MVSLKSMEPKVVSRMLIAGLMTACFLWSPQQMRASQTELRAGVSKVNITPDKPVHLASYSRDKRSESVHDSLYTRVLVLDDSEERIAIVGLDLIAYWNPRIRSVAKERWGIDQVLFNSSHSHSAPELRDNTEPEHAQTVEDAILQALDEAVNNLFPARIAAGYGKQLPALGYNRLTSDPLILEYSRDLEHEGVHRRAVWQNLVNVPMGPVDPEVGVIRVDDENGTPRMILLNYACHAVANRVNYDVSGDYPGVAAARVEEAFGSPTISMFLNGGSGDINPMFMSPDPPTDYSKIEQMGSLLAGEVVRVARGLNPLPTDSDALRIKTDSLFFQGRFSDTLSYNIHFATVVLDDKIGIATFPGEPFVWFQRFWKDNADISHPFFLGYTMAGGDWPSYVPDVTSAAYGGYGADASPRLIELGAGEKVMIRQLENLYRLRGIMRQSPGDS